jgi:hypothetical protein
MSRKFKHPECNSWLKQGNNHVMANRTRAIENNTKFAREEQWELLKVFAGAFAIQIADRVRKFENIQPKAEIGSFGELLFEAL